MAHWIVFVHSAPSANSDHHHALMQTQEAEKHPSLRTVRKQETEKHRYLWTVRKQEAEKHPCKGFVGWGGPYNEYMLMWCRNTYCISYPRLTSYLSLRTESLLSANGDTQQLQQEAEKHPYDSHHCERRHSTVHIRIHNPRWDPRVPEITEDEHHIHVDVVSGYILYKLPSLK